MIRPFSRLVPLTLGTAVAVLISGSPIAQQLFAAPAAQSTLGCSATFGNRSGDAILSDGHGPYVNGVNGVECEVFAGASNDITFYLTASKKGSRYIQFNYTDKVAGSGSGPVGTLDDQSTQSSVQDVAGLAVNVSTQTTGGFTTAIGRFAFNPPNWNGQGDYVTVIRTDPQDWSITADAAVNDVAVLVQSKGKGSVVVGQYHMPFDLTINCPGCS